MFTEMRTDTLRKSSPTLFSRAFSIVAWSLLALWVVAAMPHAAHAQMEFEGIALSNGLEKASSATGDFDGDGDIDLIVSGATTNGSSTTFLYENTGQNAGSGSLDPSTFVAVGEIGSGFAGSREISMDVGDLDGDGDLDLLITGTASGFGTQVYENTGQNAGSGSLDPSMFVVVGSLDQGEPRLGDLDGDGDLDVLVTGDQAIGYAATVYENTGQNGGDGSLGASTFQDVNAGLTGVVLGASALGDLDGDGDLDLLMTGISEENSLPSTVIYENTGQNTGTLDGSTFQSVNAGLQDVRESSISMADFDGDDDLDLLIAGFDSGASDAKTLLLRNDGQNAGGGTLGPSTFQAVDTEIPDMGQSASSVGDFDGDGDPDIVITGLGGSTRFGEVYRNTGNDVLNSSTFEPAPAGSVIDNVNTSSTSVGDFDGDFDIDLLVAGAATDGLGSVPSAAVYDNTLNIPPPFVDLDLSVAATSYEPAVGESTTITVSLSHVEGDPATDVAVDLDLPASFSLVGSSASLGTLSGTTWSIDQLAQGSTATLDLTLQKDDPAPGQVGAAVTSVTPDDDTPASAVRTLLNAAYGAGSALRLDGDGDYVELNDEAPFDFTGSFSVSFWMKTDGGFDDDWEALVVKSENTWRISREANQSHLGFHTTHGGDFAGTPGSTPVDDGVWHHVAAVYDQDAGEKRLYVDGVLDGTSSESRDVNTDDQPVRIGSNSEAAGREFGGQIDQVRLWSRPLATEEVRQFAHQSVNPGTPLEGLRASYAFSAGSMAYDASTADGAFQHGTFVGDAALETVSGAPIGNESAIAPASVGGTGASMTVNPISFASDAYVAAYRQGRADGALVDGTDPGEDFSSAPVAQRLNPVWGVWVGPEDAEGDISLAIDFSNVSGIADPSQAILLGRTVPNEPWLEVSSATLDPDARTFTYTPSRGEDESQGFQFAVAAPNDALPVELTAFTATRDGEGALLEWTTASEQNNAGFEVQRSTQASTAQSSSVQTSRRDVSSGPSAGDASRWESIGFVEGAGTTSEAQTYRFRVEDLPVGEHRFRLKQVDTDGAAHYSDAVSLTAALAGRYRLTPPRPNPASSSAHMGLVVQQSQTVRVAVYDLLGREVATAFRGTVPAQTERSIRVGSRLPAGSYFIRVTGEHFSATERLTVVR